MTVELCCDGLEAARAAAAAGADRIELCTNLACGGLTPPHEVLDEAAALGVPVHVLIRPREGDFVYNFSEIHQILFNIAYCGNSGMEGVVIGALTSDGMVDIPLCQDLIALARSYSLSVTFHRAIDRTKDIFKALEQVIELGVDRVLTSGGAESALEGAATIKKMIDLAAGSKTIIMAGAGITATNVLNLIYRTGVTEIHGSKLELLRPGILL